MTRWAIFDVDGTLLPGTSMEERFLLYLIGRGLIPFQNILNYFLTVLVGALQGNWVEALKNNKIYLKNLSVRSLERCACDFFRQHIAPALSTVGLKKIESYRQRGYKIMIMSGSPDFLTRHLQNICSPDHLIATLLKTRDGRYTGEVIGLHPYGARKREILLQLQNKLDIDLNKSVVFANHHSDVYHMELFGQAIAVNPTMRMERIARRQGWMVERWI